VWAGWHDGGGGHFHLIRLRTAPVDGQHLGPSSLLSVRADTGWRGLAALIVTEANFWALGADLSYAALDSGRRLARISQGPSREAQRGGFPARRVKDSRMSGMQTYREFWNSSGTRRGSHRASRSSGSLRNAG